MKPNDIIKAANINLGIVAGVTLKVAPDEAFMVKEADNDLVRYALQRGAIKEYFFADIKNEIRDIHLPGILKDFAKYNVAKTDRLLVCNYIPAPLKQQLKKNGINYLETTGNCFINRGAFFMFINDQKVTPQRQTDNNPIWNTTGIKFLFAILAQDGLINTTYRNMATVAGVALGNIGTFINELKRENFIAEKDGQIMLKHKDRLTERWVELYATLLQPKVRLGKFRALNEREWTANWETLLQQKQKGIPLWYVGGEPAGKLLTNHLQPEKYILYTNKEVADIIKILRLLPDPNGNIELRKAFWQDDVVEGGAIPTLNPLLVYADLMATMDGRNVETAEKIKKKYL